MPISTVSLFSTVLDSSRSKAPYRKVIPHMMILTCWEDIAPFDAYCEKSSTAPRVDFGFLLLKESIFKTCDHSTLRSIQSFENLTQYLLNTTLPHPPHQPHQLHKILTTPLTVYQPPPLQISHHPTPQSHPALQKSSLYYPPISTQRTAHTH